MSASSTNPYEKKVAIPKRRPPTIENAVTAHVVTTGAQDDERHRPRPDTGEEGIGARGDPQRERCHGDERCRAPGPGLAGELPHGDEHRRHRRCPARDHQGRGDTRTAEADAIQCRQQEHHAGRVALHVDGVPREPIREAREECERRSDGRDVGEVVGGRLERCGEAGPPVDERERDRPRRRGAPAASNNVRQRQSRIARGAIRTSTAATTTGRASRAVIRLSSTPWSGPASATKAEPGDCRRTKSSRASTTIPHHAATAVTTGTRARDRVRCNVSIVPTVWSTRGAVSRQAELFRET